MQRRSFLRKAVATAGITGGVIGTADPVLAGTQTLRVKGGVSSGEYYVTVDDPNASAQSDLESTESVQNGSTSSQLSGEVGADDEDVFTFDGQVTDLALKGSIDVIVDSPDGHGEGGELTIEGKDASYIVQVTDYMDSRSKLESSDGVTDGTKANGDLESNDTDIYYGDGTIEYVAIESASNWVTISHNLSV